MKVFEKWKKLLPIGGYTLGGTFGGASISNPFLDIPCITKICVHSVCVKCSLKFIPIDADFKCKNDKTIGFSSNNSSL